MDRGSYDCTGSSDHIIPKEKKCKKSKWLSEEALQIVKKRRKGRSKEKKKDISI